MFLFAFVTIDQARCESKQNEATRPELYSWENSSMISFLMISFLWNLFENHLMTPHVYRAFFFLLKANKNRNSKTSDPATVERTIFSHKKKVYNLFSSELLKRTSTPPICKYILIHGVSALLRMYLEVMRFRGNFRVAHPAVLQRGEAGWEDVRKQFTCGLFHPSDNASKTVIKTYSIYRNKIKGLLEGLRKMPESFQAISHPHVSRRKPWLQPETLAQCFFRLI